MKARDDVLVRNEYLQTVTGDARDAARRLEQARSALKAQQASLQAEEQAAQAALADAARARGELLAQGPPTAVAAAATPAPTATGGGGLPLPVQYLKNGSVDDGVFRFGRDFRDTFRTAGRNCRAAALRRSGSALL